MAIIWGKIYIVEDFVIKKKINEAIQIMQEIDLSDTPFIALALSIKNDGIWSEDKHFARQKEIKVWKTKDLLKHI
ncbi:MAG: hypothetical protein KGH77_01135 [Candidatus Micrarchaeota archaeon]|nr:hypothetical protein [Candidatus Micrarchaeota archaeon]MDE1864018.1 hypothetical protein [Candidatus Micrarchaeota archaeon]